MTTPQSFDFNLNRPGTLIAALPAVLGFVPHKSLVLVTVDRGEMGCVMRVDLSPDLADSLGHLVEVAASGAPESVIAVIVDDESADCRLCNDDFRYLAARLTDELAERGIGLLAAHVVDHVAVGGRWHCADGCGSGGVIEDPSSSPLAMAAVLDGRRLYRDRAELQAVIEPEAVGSAAVAAALTAQDLDGDPDGRPDAEARRDVEAVMDAAARVPQGVEFTDEELARFAGALRDIRVRDTLYALAVGDLADDAEQLWAILSRRLPEQWRVEPLTLLAFTAYARGDGPLAGVSLDAALQCDPTHRMANMLDTALQSGMRPERVRELAVTGYRLADQLGVRLPKRRSWHRRAG